MASDSLTLFDLAPGKRVADRYLIQKSHRQSDLAFSFVAEDESAGEPCELTFFPSTLFEESAQIDDFVRQCQEWKTIDSSHVVRVRDVFQMDGGTVIQATDLPDGPLLREWLTGNEAMDPQRAHALGVQLLEGVVAIHEAGLIHGDIKPSTIFVEGVDTDAPCARIADGGATPGLWHAKHLGDRTALIGTPFYAPVEQFGGDAPDTLSDIYNVATVLFELVTGTLPWPGKSFLEVFQAKLDKARPSMRIRAPKIEVSPELEDAIVRGLMADRRDRHTTSREFLRALQGVPQ